MKALASRKRSWPISVWSFFCLRRVLAQTSDLVGDGDELLGQFLKALKVGHQGLDLLGLFGGDTFGELLALDVTLQDKVGALRRFGVGARLFEELAA